MALVDDSTGPPGVQVLACTALGLAGHNFEYCQGLAGSIPKARQRLPGSNDSGTARELFCTTAQST